MKKHCAHRRRFKRGWPTSAAAKIRSTLAGLAQSGAGGGDAPSVEARLRSAAGEFVPAVGARKELNATAQMLAGDVRNALLRIKSSSKRPILKTRYELNCQFLEILMAECKREQVQLIVYVNPLNPLAENPYVASEYEEFKRWIESTAVRNAVPFANFEQLVPADEWGLLNGEPDYKHFRGAAHKRVAHELMRRFGALMTRRSP